MLPIEHGFDLVAHCHLFKHHQVVAIYVILLHKHVEVLDSLSHSLALGLGISHCKREGQTSALLVLNDLENSVGFEGTSDFDPRGQKSDDVRAYLDDLERRLAPLYEEVSIVVVAAHIDVD